MKIDYFVLNNDSARKAVAIWEASQRNLAVAKHVLVIEDQIVPANSSEVSETQQQMWSFARENGTEYVYGQAMASHYLVDNVLQGQELVLSADKDIMMIGAVGALGIYVEPEELAEYLISGNIELDLRDEVFVKITGNLSCDVDIRDAARYLEAQLRDVKKTAIVNFVDASGTLTVSDKMIICGYCQKLGVVSARFAANCESVDYVIDFYAVEAKLPATAVNTVFIGGAYGGTLEAIKEAADVLYGKTIADKVRLSVAPASAKIYCEAAAAGYLAAIIDAGGLVLNQCALPPVQARIGAGEIMLSNDIHAEDGYAGEGGSIYLTSTRAAVKAALKGRIGGEY